MLRLAADENFDNRILNELLNQQPELDIVRIQDVGLSGAVDQAILEWSAQEGRILLTHDKKTMTKYAYDRLRAGEPMPGLLVVSRNIAVSDAVEAIRLQVEASL